MALRVSDKNLAPKALHIFQMFFNFFQNFFRFFSEIFQIFLEFFQKFLKISESRNFLLPANEKCRKTSCLLLFSRFSASCFFTFCSSQVPKVEENELFCCYFQTFALVFSNFEKFQTFFRKFSDFFSENFQKFLKKI